MKKNHFIGDKHDYLHWLQCQCRPDNYHTR